MLDGYGASFAVKLLLLLLLLLIMMMMMMTRRQDDCRLTHVLVSNQSVQSIVVVAQ